MGAAAAGTCPKGASSLYSSLFLFMWAVACGILNKYLPKQGQGLVPFKTIIKLRSAAAVAAAAIIMCLQLQYLGQHLCKINSPPHVSIHPSSTGAGRQCEEGRERGGGVSCVSFVMLCRAAIDLEQTTQHISSHVPERTQQRLLASSFSPLCLSSSAGSMICISSPVPSPASSASLDLICMRALACLTLSCCQPCSGSVSYFTFISAASSSPPIFYTSSLLCFCLFMSCPSGGFTSNCCVGNAKRKVRIGPISRISSPSLSPFAISPLPHTFVGSVQRQCCGVFVSFNTNCNAATCNTLVQHSQVPTPPPPAAAALSGKV